MSTLKNRLGVAAVAALGLFAVAIAPTPAAAQIYFGVAPYGVTAGPPLPPPPPAYYYGPSDYPYYWRYPHYYYGW
jgi:hypothetical protein